MEWRLFFEWGALLIFIGLGIYTMRVVKNEHKVYLENAHEKIFKKFIFLIPHWWSEIQTNLENEICYKRTDTRYDWEAHFIWNEEKSPKDIIELFKEKIHDRKILFDEETSVIYNPTHFKETPLITSGKFEMVRLEGTATLDRQERLYYDAFLIRELETGHYLYAESKSSVLNGLVEGPYFEAVMNQIKVV